MYPWVGTQGVCSVNGREKTRQEENPPASSIVRSDLALSTPFGFKILCNGGSVQKQMNGTGAHPYGISKDAHCPVGASLIGSVGG